MIHLNSIQQAAVNALLEAMEDEDQRELILEAATSAYGHDIEWNNNHRAYTFRLKLEVHDEGWLTCSDCCGSGEGRWEGSTCLRCKGHGDARCT